MSVPQIFLPERFHANAAEQVRVRRRVPSSIGTVVVVAAIASLFVFDALNAWVQFVVSWVLFMAAVRWIGYLVGAVARR
ncbi:hypothetical protein [Euzebya tangerina]|uniref:hypothetical protein n=1 Tax=Euzebya tangerina TaxID=591198 RepID=UPI000E31DD1E|nr:hypothetical protein [Euzebya tangerina]